jgi:hypothetical protein
VRNFWRELKELCVGQLPEKVNLKEEGLFCLIVSEPSVHGASVLCFGLEVRKNTMADKA